MSIEDIQIDGLDLQSSPADSDGKHNIKHCKGGAVLPDSAHLDIRPDHFASTEIHKYQNIKHSLFSPVLRRSTLRFGSCRTCAIGT